MTYNNFQGIPENTVLEVVFLGQSLDVASVPISDLGQVLIAIQRIVNKSFLFSQNRLTKDARLTEAELAQISLQIAARRKGSDIYELASFLLNPVVQGLFATILIPTVAEVIKYYVERRIKSDEQEEKPIIQPLVFAVYSDFTSIVQVIDGKSGTEAIGIGTPSQPDIPPVLLSRDVKRYIRELRNETIFGIHRTIFGRITNFSVEEKSVKIVHNQEEVTIYLGRDDFNHVRKSVEDDSVVEFYGYPVYRFGSRSHDFNEFRGEKIRILST